MSTRRRGNKLERWEIALVKAMLRRGSNDQDILSYFTRPTRSVNHRAIGEIRTEKKHKTLKPALDEELDAFLATWPEYDPTTGLSIRGDELLIKARDAMIAAVHTFNGAGLHFRAELFIVTSVIAWTYLLHAFYKREWVDYRFYKNNNGVREVMRTEHGAEKYWELGRCLRENKCPLDKSVKTNLEFILELRHEIEHRSTGKIDDAVSAKLQGCCLNFNEAIRSLFGTQYGLERRLPIALQFSTFSPDQRGLLKRASVLPANIEIMMNSFHGKLREEEQADPRFAYRVAFVQKVAAKASNSDIAVEFVKPGTPEAEKINMILLKEVERTKYKPKQIFQAMHSAGFRKFNMHHHTELWKSMDARDEKKGYGVEIFGGDWCWLDRWKDTVRDHCIKKGDLYR